MCASAQQTALTSAVNVPAKVWPCWSECSNTWQKENECHTATAVRKTPVIIAAAWRTCSYAAICDSWLISCMSVYKIKHCTLIKIRPTQLHSPEQLMLTQAESVGGAYAGKQPIRGRLPATTCMMKVPRRGSSCCSSDICSNSWTVRCVLSTVWVQHAADGTELVLLLPAAAAAGGQRREAARGRGEGGSHAQTFPLSPQVQVRRHAAGASWRILRERDRVSLQVRFTVTSRRPHGCRHLVNSLLVWG